MHERVLDFWFNELKPAQWWVKDETLDVLILERFLSTYEQASRGELYEWRESPRGRLAEIIVLDQFARNMFRNSARSFSADPLALALSQSAVSVKADAQLSDQECAFLYMPYMHSESLKIHDVAVKLFEKNGLQSNIDSENRHRDVIRAFGRYPHRNEALGRDSTQAEKKFLAQPGSKF